MPVEGVVESVEGVEGVDGVVEGVEGAVEGVEDVAEGRQTVTVQKAAAGHGHPSMPSMLNNPSLPCKTHSVPSILENSKMLSMLTKMLIVNHDFVNV